MCVQGLIYTRAVRLVAYVTTPQLIYITAKCLLEGTRMVMANEENLSRFPRFTMQS